MCCYDEELKILSEQKYEKNRIETIVKNLEKQWKELSHKTEKLKAELDKKQADVEALKGLSLKALFYKLCGNSGEKLNNEQEEAYIAAIRYNNAIKEVEDIESEILNYNKRLREIRNCEKQYEVLFIKKKEAVKNSGSEASKQIFEFEEKLKITELQKKELTEAITAGNNALSICDRMLSELSSAESWGTYDLIGGGTIAALAKHGHLDTAQEKVVYLKQALRRFKTELADIKIHTDLKVNIDGTLRFADYFFDNIITDWMVLDRIEGSVKEVNGIRAKIRSILTQITEIKKSTEKEEISLKAKIDLLVSEEKI